MLINPECASDSSRRGSSALPVPQIILLSLPSVYHCIRARVVCRGGGLGCHFLVKTGGVSKVMIGGPLSTRTGHIRRCHGGQKSPLHSTVCRHGHAPAVCLGRAVLGRVWSLSHSSSRPVAPDTEMGGITAQRKKPWLWSQAV